MSERVADQLVCAECGTTAPPDAHGWKAEIGDDPCDEDPPEVVMFCAECWQHEFDEK
jgi:hypothetical protein